VVFELQMKKRPKGGKLGGGRAKFSGEKKHTSISKKKIQLRGRKPCRKTSLSPAHARKGERERLKKAFVEQGGGG